MIAFLYTIVDYAMDNDNHRRKIRTTSIALIAIVAALSMLGVVVLTVTVAIPIQEQHAEAAKSLTGQCASAFKNASSSVCHTL